VHRFVIASAVYRSCENEAAAHDVDIYFPAENPDPKFYKIRWQVFCAMWQALNVPDPEFTHDLAPLLPNATPPSRCPRTGHSNVKGVPKFPPWCERGHDPWKEELLIASATVDSTPCGIVISVTAFSGPM